MNNYQTDIEKYLDGAMDANEMKTFEDRLQRDSMLKEAYEDELSARALIQEAGRDELRETLQNIEIEMENESGQGSESSGRIIPLWMKRTLPIAAMVIIFLGVFQWLQSGVTTGEVYDTYFEAYASPSVVRDSNDEPQVNWETAARLYSEKKYSRNLRIQLMCGNL